MSCTYTSLTESISSWGVSLFLSLAGFKTLATMGRCQRDWKCFKHFTFEGNKIKLAKNTCKQKTHALQYVIYNLRRVLTGFLLGLRSSRGTISIRKSNWSYFDMAVAISFRCRKIIDHIYWKPPF